GHRGQRGRRRPPRVRVLLREPRLRPGHHRAGGHLHRPAAGRDGGDERQDQLPTGRRRGRGGGGAGAVGAADVAGRGGVVRGGARVAGGHQGRLRRRRPGDEGGPLRRRGGRGGGVGPAGGAGLLRPAGGVRRAVPV